MARIVFEVDLAADTSPIVAALDTERGIASWWTEDVTFAGGVGSTMTLGFPTAPKPFVLQVAEVGPQRVRWESIGDFPPHWVGTEIIWTLSANPDGGTTVHFAHEGWADDGGPFPMAAFTWAQLLLMLKAYAETGQAAPLFRKT
jgi:uncharacterized protein YndB with AHSA1/START domain